MNIARMNLKKKTLQSRKVAIPYSLLTNVLYCILRYTALHCSEGRNKILVWDKAFVTKKREISFEASEQTIA